MQNRTLLAGLSVLSAFLLLLSSGCSHSGVTAGAEMKSYAIKRLLLVPMTNSTVLHKKGDTVLCSICGAAYTSDVVESDAQSVMTQKVSAILEGKTSVNIIPLEQLEAMRERLLSSSPESISEKGLLGVIGRNLNADGVLTGSIYLYKNRIGYSYAAESPASIGFHLDLIDTQSGKIIWSRRYEEKQQPLSDNLFDAGEFIKRKGKWLTVEDLADSGLQKLFETIPISNEK